MMDLEEQRDFSRDPTLYPWLKAMHRKLISQTGTERPEYAWGVLHGANLSKYLQIPPESPYWNLEWPEATACWRSRKSQFHASRLPKYKIDVYGFDTGVGLPKPVDYRDSPNLFSENDFPMDVENFVDNSKEHAFFWDRLKIRSTTLQTPVQPRLLL